MTERQKALIWKKTQAKRDRFADRMTPTWKRALMAQIQPVLKEIDASSVRSIEDRIPQLIQEDAIQEALEKTLEVVAVYFARATYRDIRKALAQDWIIKAGGLPTNEEFMNDVNWLLGDLAGERITAITGASKDRAVVIIKRSLQEATTEGLGASQMALKLRDDLGGKWGTDATYRAARIARTETTMASNMGSMIGAKKTGEPMLKVWLSTRDSRTRRPKRRNRYDHYGSFPTGPDGEKAEMDRPFIKTGESLDYPGDYNGSAGNVINCRCTLYYEPKQDDLGGGEVVDPPTVEPPKPKPPPTRRPGDKKPFNFTREEKIKEAKEKLAKIKETGKNHRKLAALEKEIDPIQLEYDTIDHYLRAEMRKLPGTTGVERDEIVAKIVEYQNKRKPLADKLIKLGQQKIKIKALLADDVADILSLGKDGTINVTRMERGARVRTGTGVITNNGKVRTKEVDIFRRIMGDVDPEKYATDCKYFSSQKNKRAFCSGDTAYLFSDDGAETVCHELGHAMEHQNAFMADKSVQFLERRCTGDKLVNYYKGTSYEGKRPPEWLWEDKFLEKYTGKCYQKGVHEMPGQEGKLFSRDLVPHGRTEAFSMWWTHVIKEPAYFVLEDPDHFEFFYDMILQMQGVP